MSVENTKRVNIKSSRADKAKSWWTERKETTLIRSKKPSWTFSLFHPTFENFLLEEAKEIPSLLSLCVQEVSKYLPHYGTYLAQEFPEGHPRDLIFLHWCKAVNIDLKSDINNNRNKNLLDFGIFSLFVHKDLNELYLSPCHQFITDEFIDATILPHLKEIPTVCSWEDLEPTELRQGTRSRKQKTISSLNN
jgi:hypothetical protein